MRKIKILLLSLLLAFCMAGCSEGSSVAISGSGDETAGKISQNGSGMEVHFIDVGQGDSTLIKAMRCLLMQETTAKELRYSLI